LILCSSSSKRPLVNKYKEEAKYNYYNHKQAHHLDYQPLIDVAKIYKRYVIIGVGFCQAF
jgi:hypothetical protein